MGHHRALGLAGGARGVKLERVVLGPHLMGRRGRGKAIAPLAVIKPRMIARINAHDVLHIGRLAERLCQNLGKAFAHKHHARLRVAEDIGNLGRGQPPVYRRHHRAHARCTQQRFEIERVVLAEEGHTLARLDAECCQGVRHPVRACVQFGKGDDFLTIGEGGHIALCARVFAHDIAKGLGGENGGVLHGAGT